MQFLKAWAAACLLVGLLVLIVAPILFISWLGSIGHYEVAFALGLLYLTLAITIAAMGGGR